MKPDAVPTVKCATCGGTGVIDERACCMRPGEECCGSYNGYYGPCACQADEDVDERDDSPYCDCGAIATQDEEDSGCCSCCGKIVEWTP